MRAGPRQGAGTTAAAPTSELPLLQRPGGPAVLHVDADDPVRWAFETRLALGSAVARHGAVLVRGLGLDEQVVTGDVVRMLADRLMTEHEPLAPRTAYSDDVYSSKPWSHHTPMGVHHEMCYRESFPGLMMFACLQPATAGGATVLADAAAVLEALPSGLVRRCARDGWLLVRNYNDDIGSSWPEVFGVSDRTTVEQYCRAHAIDYEWRPGGRLRTRQRRPAIVRHPVNGVRCWFNGIAFYSEWSFGAEVRDFLADSYGPDCIPITTAFGDGSPVGPETVFSIEQAYADNAVREPWQAGDLLVVDNIRTAHGRDRYLGRREVLVALADPTRV